MNTTTTLSEYTPVIVKKEVEVKYPPQVRYELPLNVGGVILLYIVLFSLSFIVLITFNPGFVHQSAPPGVTPSPNFGTCFISALVASLLLCIIILFFLII